MLNALRTKVSSILISAFLLCGCSEEPPVAMVSSDINPKVEIIKGVELIYSEAAQVKARITADSARRVKEKEPYLEFPVGLKAEFFSEKGIKTSSLSARYAIKYDKKEEIIIRDSVVVHSTNNEILETDELIWSEKKEKVISDKVVKITTEREQLRAQGFESNLDFTKYKTGKLIGRKLIDRSEHPMQKPD